MKTNMGLVEYAKKQLGLPYWYGTFGQTATSQLYTAKKKQYPLLYKSWNDFPQQYGKRVHDCVGLIKGYLWSDNATAKPTYKASQDVSANQMLSVCKEKGPIATMPETPGVLVFMNGHVGVYIGNGEVIEARGHEYGVVKTKLKSRPWKNWGKCPYISYTVSNDGLASETTKPANVNTTNKTVVLKSGKWNVRKTPTKTGAIITTVSSDNTLVVNDDFYYVPSLGGFISKNAVKK